MHSVETVTARESREDKYSMIDRGEQYSCVPLTFPPWLLPAPDLSHLSWLPKDTDSLDMILFTPGIKTLSKDWLFKEHPALNLCGFHTWARCTLEWLRLQQVWCIDEVHLHGYISLEQILLLFGCLWDVPDQQTQNNLQSHPCPSNMLEMYQLPNCAFNILNSLLVYLPH